MPGKCPQCNEADIRSTVTGHDESTTLLMDYQYYDEDGRYHSHDPNWTSSDYRCSNGHQWTERSQNGCEACGTDGEQRVI